MEDPSGNAPPQKHVRHGSAGRASVIRRNTRGPLDMNDSSAINPLSPLNRPGPQLLSPRSVASPRLQSPRLQSPGARSPGRSPSLPPSSLMPVTKDFSHLLRPEVYHPLPHLDIPPPFRSSPQQPEASTPLEVLLAHGHFRSAAIAAALLLTSNSPPVSSTDYEQIFFLLYTRLSCLILSGNTSFAAQEALALEDLNSAYYRSDMTGAHLVPWELRILAVRLQGMGFNDARRGVMGYYDLGREARTILSKLKSRHRTTSIESEKLSFQREIKLWETRLADLGIRVASALIEMEDLEGAALFMKSLEPTPAIAFQVALLWLCLGDIEAARLAITPLDKPQQPTTSKYLITQALACVAEGDYEVAVDKWQSLVGESLVHMEEGEQAMCRQNMAVTLIYLGRMDEAKRLLEREIENGFAFHALTFNLSTVYELCTERSRNLKINLAEKVAARDQVKNEGWEKVNMDFKL
ncbi:tetratricopeptide repeat protein 15 [Phlyctema vagabunda]|uniref:Tetratricopeptide repeat protein 15 n=1 Tax=Phlyctema vagabunda TaxID=108571 RepID=A0ABR4PXI4_9HELO